MQADILDAHSSSWLPLKRMAKTTDKLHPEENTESVATGQQTNNASQTHSKHAQINKKPKQQAKNTETNTVKTTD